MRVLVISHACVRRSWRSKFNILAAGHPEFVIRIVVPQRWLENYEYIFEDTDPDEKVSVIRLPNTFPGYGERHFYLWGLARQLRTFKPDIIHLEQEPFSLVALQVVLLKRLFAPNARLLIRTSTGGIFRRMKLHWLASLAERVSLNEADGFFYLYSGALKRLQDRVGRQVSMFYHPNGVDPSVFSPRQGTDVRKKLGLQGAYVIGYVGRFVPEKGIQYLIDALAQLNMPDARLLLVGTGPYRPTLEERAAQLGILERLVFHPVVKQRELVDLYSAMNVMVLPSYSTPLWEEFFGRVLVEAMSCGVPVIGTASGGIPEVIRACGAVVAPKDSRGLADAIHAARHTPPEQLEQQIVAAQSWTRERFSWESLAGSLFMAYSRVLGG
ncbi:MAG: glycosyltransferase family 4 protein [Bacillota bacterium]|nr:glycosyltransferase family 4 protein [Bacillota bacterium]